MNFVYNPLSWENGGKEPSTTLKEEGFAAGYKPPADYFNYKWQNDYNCIVELQEKLGGLGEAISGKLVASFDSAENVKKCADFICGETNAEVTINQALAEGGSVILADGTYNCSREIFIKIQGSTLTGCGWNTVINTNSTAAYPVAVDVIGDYTTLKNMRIISSHQGSCIHFNALGGQASNNCDFEKLVIECENFAFDDGVAGSTQPTGGLGCRIVNCDITTPEDTACDFRNKIYKFYSGNRVNGVFTDNLAGE